MLILKNNFKLTHFVGILSVLNFLFFHLPFFNFVFNNIDYRSFNGILTIVSLVFLMLILNAFLFYMIFALSNVVGKSLLVVFFIINSVAIYFVNTFGVIIDESMVGNVLNTKYSEASSFFSIKFVFSMIFSVNIFN